MSSKIRGDIRSSRCTTGVIDIGGKFTAGINDISGTGGKFTAGAIVAGGKLAAGVVDTGDAP
jgi:hypothetical protein